MTTPAHLASLLGLPPSATLRDCEDEIRRLRDVRRTMAAHVARLEAQVAELRRVVDAADDGDDGL